MSPEQRLLELGLVLPDPISPAGNYVAVACTGPWAYVSGQGPVNPLTGDLVTGKVGGAVTLEEGREAARLTALSVLSVLRAELGTLDRVTRIVKVLGMVNVAPGFTRTPEVIDGCSELLHYIFGEAGRHARSAVGVAELPFDISVEIELVAFCVHSRRRR